ncbi:hypothetical protein B0H67DRAFT_500029 [Lasiosphaeris hirsuta]|uniref:Uncharacterized protein n=1 Tax=Lasiosphaeris hirsuta TaxID=260670 RepID=A0AA40DGL8_9PEZI|nr:hypothetical protein B0H67DRAFT_500029 [Lasiosphaeris hirsuta]
MHGLRHIKDVENAWRNYETTAFVYIPNPQEYSLRPNKGVIAGTENVYMISAHHQLHCLKKLQLGHVAAVMGDSNYTMAKEHAEHCFDYLRQAILCAGDSTLEGVDPGTPGLLQGYGARHTCRLWNGPEGLDTWRQMHCAGEGLGCHD